MKYYTHNNSTPAPLPFRIVMPDGSTRTDPTSFTSEEIAAAGYVEVPSPPGYNSATQHPPQWDGTSWNVIDLTEQELLDRLPPYYETSTGIKLATGEHDQNAFSRLVNLVEISQMEPTSMLIIKDAEGQKHAITVSEFRSVMKEYGAHCYALHAGE